MESTCEGEQMKAASERHEGEAGGCVGSIGGGRRSLGCGGQTLVRDGLGLGCGGQTLVREGLGLGCGGVSDLHKKQHANDNIRTPLDIL